MAMSKRSRVGLKNLPADVWALGLVSMFMDTSSELIHSVLPIFMVSVLGASMVTIGFVEGVAEATASITKVFSGVLSDRWRKRKHLVVAGYSLAALTKPVFPLAGSIGAVFAARFIDRIGKGIRGAPRDALIADITPKNNRGAAYGLRQSLDTVGAVAGPLLALALMAALDGNIRSVLWFAVVPAAVAVLVLTLGVHEPSAHSSNPQSGQRISIADTKSLGKVYWMVVLLGGFLTLARFSEAFLLLRAQSVGISSSQVPITFVVMNVAYAVSSYPAGKAADRMDKGLLLSAGIIVLIIADLILASAESVALVLTGAAVWGLHMGLTQGLLSALVADAAPQNLRGTAFGIFNLVSGGFLLLASVIAGFLWSHYGAPATFAAGGAFSALTLVGFLVLRWRTHVFST
jgi:MFS family permease